MLNSYLPLIHVSFFFMQSNPDLSQSTFIELQRSAHTFDDVVAWIGKNLPLFGLTPPQDPDNLSVDAAVDISALCASTERDCLNVVITISVMELPQIVPWLQSSMRITSGSANVRKHAFDMQFQLRDWSFLVPALSVCYFNSIHAGGELRHSPSELAKLKTILETQIPFHFPVFTLNRLEAMYASGLLTVDEDDNLDLRNLSSMLFTSRSALERSDEEMTLPTCD